MKNYRLAIDGDRYEQYYWSLFIQNNFQSYEDFWIENIVLLTNRPQDIHFKTDQELAKIGKTDNDICIAQLHYSILRHLARAFDIWNKDRVDLDDLTDGMTRLCGALDVTFELLERFENPSNYDSWLARKNNGNLGGEDARKNWKEKYPENIKLIRYYRNHLVHGRMTPGIIEHIFYFPKISMEEKYFDWREITFKNEMEKNKNNFMSAKEILELAWHEVVDYLDNQWRIHLLKQENPDKDIDKSNLISKKTASGVWSKGTKVFNTSATQLSGSVYETGKDEKIIF
ncbi:MAG: hypothetical protein Q7U36_00570 [bacterium]|nr:hypothetical protein [bacterium]